jgi:uncharacterized SAM-binding protein YcdF (DUF218 family)
MLGYHIPCKSSQHCRKDKLKYRNQIIVIVSNEFYSSFDIFGKFCIFPLIILYNFRFMLSSITERFRWFQRFFFRGFRYLLTFLGIILLLAIILSFTDYPFWAYYWLGTHNTELELEPAIIVIMGGGGMPSPDGLIRCYYGASIGNEYPNAKVIIAVPEDTSMHKESPELLMVRELEMRGIDSARVKFEKKGHNTRTQVLNIRSMLGSGAIDTIPVRIVTTPEHMFRSVASFRKAGFTHVGGAPAFEEAIGEQLLIEKARSKRVQLLEKHSLNFRYNIWNYLKYEVTVVREYTAILYYKIRGWI